MNTVTANLVTHMDSGVSLVNKNYPIVQIKLGTRDTSKPVITQENVQAWLEGKFK